MEEPQVGSSGYELFINFRGEDTRYNFVSHLYTALEDRGIRAYIDSKDLPKGEDIENLLNVISGCKLSIAVFSQRYAESKWCLKELSQMLETKDHIIVPVFFKVDTAAVKNQTGCFEISPLTHSEEEPETLSRWKNALKIAGNQCGWVHHDRDDESELVNQVVQDVSNRLDKVYLMGAKYPVGLESFAQHIRELLSDEKSDDVQFLGICGQGGIGKTAIAITLYNCISKIFRKHCFLENVKQASQPSDLVSLQQKLLNSVSGVETRICSSMEGSQKIKERFQNKKTLLVLDDVDNQTQLNALAGASNWFGPRSRIIITTRDRSVLSAVPEENRMIYEHGELNQEESLKLFSLHAFSTNKPPEEFMPLSLDMVRTTGGLPLALEVLGLDVFKKKVKKDQQFWNSMLQMRRRTLHEDVFKRLKISYDSLDENEKAMFLDVACLFIGWQEETVISIWEACDFDARYQLEVLKEKSLLKIDGSTTKALWMHHQIRDMGRMIAYSQEFGNPHKYTRLWSHKKTMKVLKSCKGNEMVEGLFLDLEIDKRINLHTKYFEMMPKLRLLNIDGASMEGNFQHLPSALKWFQWRRCPLEKLSANFFHEDLVMLDLSHGSFRQAWENWRENGRFQQLKVLQLSYCMCLSQSPDFSGFPHLERLYLDHCGSLVTLQESIGKLQQLAYLNLECCSSLKKLPNNICSVRTLENLILKECKSLKTLPGSIGKLKESLIELSLDGTRIETLPDGIALLKKLKILSLFYNRALMSLPKLDNLTSLCEFLIGGEHENFLDISVLYTLVESLGNMKNMKKLEVLSLGAFCVKMEQFRGVVNASNNELRELIGRMCRYSNVVTNQRSWHRQDQQGTSSSLRSSIGNWRQIWIPLQMSTDDDGSLKRYLIPEDIDEIGACRLVAHVTLNFHSAEDADITYIRDTGRDISLTFDSHVVHMEGNKIAHEIGLVIEGSNKLIGPGQVVYIHEFKGFDWFGVQLEGVDAIEISDVSVNFVLWLEVLGVNLFLVKESPMFDSHQFSNNAEICQSYGDERCLEIVRYAPTEDEVSNLLGRKKRRGLMKCIIIIIMIMIMTTMMIFILMKRRSSVADYMITETIRCMTLSPNRFCFSS